MRNSLHKEAHTTRPRAKSCLSQPLPASALGGSAALLPSCAPPVLDSRRRAVEFWSGSEKEREGLGTTATMVLPVPLTKRQKRDDAVAELLRSEAAYVSDLKLLVDVFLLPLQRWARELEAQRELAVDDDYLAGEWAPDFSQEDCDKIFANTLQLARFNRQFFLDLTKAHGGPFVVGQPGAISPVASAGDWRKVKTASDSLDEDDNENSLKLSTSEEGPRQMLQVFLKSAPFLKMYSAYVNNFDAAMERLTALERDNLSFSAFLTACEKQKPCRGLRLRDFLILPVQRIQRYRLLLETILQHTVIEGSMHSKVEDSLTTMGGISSKINADSSLSLQKNKVHQLQEEFGGAGFFTASRVFIREGDLFKVARNGVEKLRFVLFNDLLVYGQAKRRREVYRGGAGHEQLYHHRRSIDLGKTFVVDAPSHGSGGGRSTFLGETGFLVVADDKSFMVMASTAAEKDAWLHDIRQCMIGLAANEGSSSPDRFFSPMSAAATTVAARAPQPRSRAAWVPGNGKATNVYSHSHGISGGGGGVGSNSTTASSQLRIREVYFRLPAWAGGRTSCGYLCHFELTWGKGEEKENEGLAAVPDSGGGGSASGVSGDAGGGSSSGRNGVSGRRGGAGVRDERGGYDDAMRSGGAARPSGGTDSPKKVSLVISMKRLQPMGLRLRDLHPDCGGGVVVVGFERAAAGKRAGVLQGDRITEIDGFSVSSTADIVWALQQSAGTPFLGSDIGNSGGARRQIHLNVLRGFPKRNKPWMPRLTVAVDSPPTEGSPVLTPPSSAVQTPGSDEVNLPSPELSAPGRKTFSGIGRSGNNLGFAAGGAAGDSGAGSVGVGGVRGGATTAGSSLEAAELPSAAVAAATAGSAPGVAETETDDVGRSPVATEAAAPPSPETAFSSSTPARTFSGADTPSSKTHGFGFSPPPPSDDDDGRTPLAATRPGRQQSYISTRAATVEIGRSPRGDNQEAAPPSPGEGKGEEDSGSADSNGGARAKGPASTQANADAPRPGRQQLYISARAGTVEIGCSPRGDHQEVAPPSPVEGKGEEDSGSADSNGGVRAKGPAPTQANADAGGAPAMPFAVFRGGRRPSSSLDGQGQGHRQGQRRRPSLGLEVSNALAACWSAQANDDDDDDENSRPVDFEPDNDAGEEERDTDERTLTPVVQKPLPVLLADVSRGTSASTVVGERKPGDRGNFGDDGNDANDSEFQGMASATSEAVSPASSTGSSLFLTAVSPSRVPPPLVSVASTLPLPPVSMASSVRSDSFSNPWESPTAVDVSEDLDSMSWLQPLPPPPTAQPRGEDAPPNDEAKTQDFGPFMATSSATTASNAPPPNRGGTVLAYPSGRWVQTPPRGEILPQARVEAKYSGGGGGVSDSSQPSIKG